MDQGAIVCDAPPQEFLAWALSAAPELATPGARLLDRLGLHPGGRGEGGPGCAAGPGSRPTGSGGSPPPGARPAAAASPDGLHLDRVWHEFENGAAILRAITLQVAPGERVAVMGANGAGKSTLLRHAASLMAPTRGRVTRSGPVRLLLQNPTDYLVHENVAAEASAGALRAAGLDPVAFGPRHPRELSVGEKQLLALAVVLDGLEPPAFLCLDEPTRGLDRRRKSDLAGLLVGLEAAVIVATHDPEFVAEFADRVVLLGEGRVIADGRTPEILARGTYFATETARILGGAGGALTPDQGARLLGASGTGPVPEHALAEAPL